MAGLFDTFLDAYTAPNQRAQEQQAYERAAPQRTADAWGIVNSQMDDLANPKPDMTSVEKYDPLTNPTSKLELPKEQRKLSQDELYKARISALIASGDPTLQKQGISMLPEYYKSQAPDGEGTNDYKNYLAATRPENRSPEGFQRWMDNKKTKMFESTGSKPFTVGDRQKIIITDRNGDNIPLDSLPPNLSPDMLTRRGWNYKPKDTSTDVSSAANIEQMDASFENILDMEDIDLGDQLDGIVANLRTDGSDMSNVGDMILTYFGNELTSPQAEYISNIKNINSTMLKLMSGMAATDPEYKRIKSQLPNLGQNDELRKANMKRTRSNFKLLKKRYSGGRGIEVGKDKPATGQDTYQSLLDQGWKPVE